MFKVRSMPAALTAVLVLTTACASHDGRHAPEVRADAELGSLDSRTVASAQPEYVEAATPPATPMSVVEERPQAPSAAHVWISGQHTRRYGQWVWKKGHYQVPPRAGLVWVPGHWVAHGAGYVWLDGGWR